MIKLKNLIKIVLSISIFQSSICCSNKTVLLKDVEYNFEGKKVKEGVTRFDSLISFRNYLDGFGVIKDSSIVVRINEDSVANYGLNEFKSLEIVDKLNTYIIIGILVGVLTVFAIELNDSKIGG